jgi:hypothetical protein
MEGAATATSLALQPTIRNHGMPDFIPSGGPSIHCVIDDYTGPWANRIGRATLHTNDVTGCTSLAS